MNIDKLKQDITEHFERSFNKNNLYLLKYNHDRIIYVIEPTCFNSQKTELGYSDGFFISGDYVSELSRNGCFEYSEENVTLVSVTENSLICRVLDYLQNSKKSEKPKTDIIEDEEIYKIKTNHHINIEYDDIY